MATTVSKKAPRKSVPAKKKPDPRSRAAGSAERPRLADLIVEVLHLQSRVDRLLANILAYDDVSTQNVHNDGGGSKNVRPT